LSQPEPSESPGSIRVLHVDDDLNQLSFAKVFLESTDPGLHVVSVSSPNDTLNLLRKESFDCVVSDYQMPGLDGIELARRIREISDIPLIIYTGHGSEEVAEAAFTAGVDDYLRKEVNPSHYQVLAKRIRSAAEKHAAEENLRLEHNKAQQYLDVAGVILVALDARGHITLLNKKGCETLEVLEEDALGRDWFENFVPVKVRGEVKEIYNKRMAGDVESVEYIENPVLSRKGRECLMAWHNCVLVDAHGKIVGTLSSGNDVTELKRMEAELKNSERKLRSIVSLSIDGFNLVDVEGIIIEWDRGQESITGITRDEAIGKPFWDIIYQLAVGENRQKNGLYERSKSGKRCLERGNRFE